MTFKKEFNSDDIVIVGKDKKNAELLKPGFRYVMSNVIYTVRADVTQEKNSPMLEVSLSDGKTEIIPVEIILKDINDPLTKILKPDPRLSPKKEDKTKEDKTKKDKTKKDKTKEDKKKTE